ncbi:MAG: hypothetical protein H0T92_12695, partial [Pyrinomonadaceae bacterium]|nr:hypothetical protein [Pyrinomonadaceae bacterium]
MAQAATLTVPVDGNLQAALEAAQPGDTIVLEAGATFVGPITLPAKTGDAFITIESSRLAELPGDGQRVAPEHAALMPKIVSPGGNQAALRTAAYAHHYRLRGIELMPKDATVYVRELVQLGSGDVDQNTLARVPHHLVLDRCYIHAWPEQELIRGVALNSAHTEIIGCYIADFKSKGFDSQA